MSKNKMVIKPEQVLKITSEEEGLISELEQIIDKFLKETIGEECRTETTYALPDSANKRVIKEIILRYRTIGWDVTYKSDQRDGNYLRFKLKEPVGD